MNRDPIPVILAGLLLASVTATAGLCYWYLQCTRQNQQAQMEVARINANRALVQTFANECVEYSKQNPAIIPVLQHFGMRAGAETNSTASGRK